MANNRYSAKARVVDMQDVAGGRALYTVACRSLYNPFSWFGRREVVAARVDDSSLDPGQRAMFKGLVDLVRGGNGVVRVVKGQRNSTVGAIVDKGDIRAYI